VRQPSRVAREIADFLEGKHAYPVGTPRISVPKRMLERWLMLLAAPKRKVRPRDPMRAARRSTVKELDALCREVVFARDNGTCRHCGKPAQDWSHVYSRRYKWLRWDLDNSFASCKGCHLWWHGKPLDASMWWAGEIGVLAHSRLVERAARPSKVNLEAVRTYLEQASATAKTGS
jgi:hypothetical protein